MEEIKGLSDAEARRWLQKHGYGVGEIEGIMAGEDMCANPGPPRPQSLQHLHLSQLKQLKQNLLKLLSKQHLNQACKEIKNGRSF